MEREHLNFRHNACKIDLMVAGSVSQASGFVYRTKPSCEYDYVLTVKHAFQEGKEMPNVTKLSNLKIRYGLEVGGIIELYDKKTLAKNLLFLEELDMTIIRVKKQHVAKVKRIAVRNAVETHDDFGMAAHAFMTIKRDDSTLLNCEWKERERGIFRVDDIKQIERYGGASGSGIYGVEEPFLIGLLSGYRLPCFEQNEICMVMPDWGKINEILGEKHWTKLNEGNARLTAITEDREVIDIRELEVNGAVLNMDIAIKRMQHDLIDDWFFDPLQYVDMCNTEFVLDYFARVGNRHNYKSEKMEVFYLPKKSFVLRKAMVGTFMDRLLYMACVSQLGPLIDKHLSKYVFSARYNMDEQKSGLIVQGVEQWTKKNYLLSSWVSEATTGCLVKLDLLNYYDTINKNTLIRLLNEIAETDNDKACIKLLSTLIDGFSDKEVNHGIPQNSDASSLLATFYVSHVDEFVLSKALHFCRFMDDMYFVAKDIYEARDLLQTIEKHLRQIDLSLNAQKISFVRLDNETEKADFLKSLSLYDKEKSEIKYLIKSTAKSKRMGAIALLVKQLETALKPADNDNELDKDRALKFAASAFSSIRLQLDSSWDNFYKTLATLSEEQVDAPDHTPMICRLVSSIGSWRDITEIKVAIKKLLLRQMGSIYEWQAYHLWMLMAYLKYDDSELVKYAVDEIEKNDETRRVEVAAIIIYMVTINREYARVILHKLRDGQLHGNLQCRCALIALRSLDHQVVDDEVSKAVGNDALCLSHAYLTRHKDKPLVFFHQISSFQMESNESLFPELYSGL
jgi:hypothetical protein